MEEKQAELAADLAVVALLRFLDAREVCLQLVLAEERRAVDALHRLIARIALPVRVRRRQQLERLQPAAGRHVRTDAEVDERVAVLDRVDRHVLLAGRLLLDQLHLERLAAPAEEGDRFLARPHLPLVDEVGRGDLAHALFDLRRDPPARTASRPRSRRRSLRRSAVRCRTAPSERAASRPRRADAPCCAGTPSALPDPSTSGCGPSRLPASGYVRSTTRSFTIPAYAACARRGDIDAAISPTVVARGTDFVEPSGRVMVSWDKRWLNLKSKNQSRI